MLFIFVLSICLFTERGRILNLFFPAYRCIRILFCMPFSFLFSHLLFRAGLVHFHRSRVRIGSHDLILFIIYIYVFFEISFLSKPALYSSSCQDTGIGREEEEVRKQKKTLPNKREKKKKKKRENHNVLLSY